MNITKLAASAAGAALTIGALAATTIPAGAATYGCTTAKVTCGTFTSAAVGPDFTPLPTPLSWVAGGKGRAGDAIVAGADSRTNTRTDFCLTGRGRDVHIEYCPGGHQTHRYVMVNVVGAYRLDGVVVKPGGLVLAGWNSSWAERWVKHPVASGGYVLVNDMSGMSPVPVTAGTDIVTRADTLPRLAAWGFVN